MHDGLIAETLTLGVEGRDLPVYLARPLGTGPFPAVVMLHHRDGWDPGSKEIARRLAASGVVCILPHLHDRHAPGQPPAVAAQVVRDAGGLSDAACLEDAAAALDHVRRQPYANGRVGVLGFCSGGRQGFLAAAELPFDAAILCYGPRIPARKHTPTDLSPVAPLSRAEGIRGAVLGIFGGEDRVAPPEDADEIAAELGRLGKTHRVRVFEGAGHAFFATERENFHVEAAREGWEEILAWIEAHLGTDADLRIGAGDRVAGGEHPEPE